MILITNTLFYHPVPSSVAQEEKPVTKECKVLYKRETSYKINCYQNIQVSMVFFTYELLV